MSISCSLRSSPNTWIWTLCLKSWTTLSKPCKKELRKTARNHSWIDLLLRMTFKYLNSSILYSMIWNICKINEKSSLMTLLRLLNSSWSLISTRTSPLVSLMSFKSCWTNNQILISSTIFKSRFDKRYKKKARRSSTIFMRCLSTRDHCACEKESHEKTYMSFV